MPTVWVPNKGAGHDLSAAERYGTIRYLSEGPISKYAVGKMFRLFAMQLRESGKGDFILQTGLTMMNVIACACFVELHHRLNLLVYKNNYYLARTIILDSLMKSDGEKQMEELI
jgi:hypothetical protein